MRVSPEIKNARLAICKACPAHTKHLGQVWCGKPVIGGTYKAHKLCGCDMNLKTELKASTCPAGKWNSQRISDTDILKARQLIEMYEAHNKSDIKALHAIHYKITGEYRQPSSCGSCLKNIINELKAITGWNN